MGINGVRPGMTVPKKVWKVIHWGIIKPRENTVKAQLERLMRCSGVRAVRSFQYSTPLTPNHVEVQEFIGIAYDGHGGSNQRVEDIQA